MNGFAMGEFRSEIKYWNRMVKANATQGSFGNYEYYAQ